MGVVEKSHVAVCIYVSKVLVPNPPVVVVKAAHRPLLLLFLSKINNLEGGKKKSCCCCVEAGAIALWFQRVSIDLA